MQIILTITMPNENVAKMLADDDMTIDEFKKQMTDQFSDMNAEDLCFGAVAKLEIKD